MAGRISRDTKQDAVIMNAKGVTQPQIAAALGISESVIKRAKARDRKYGDVEGGKQKCGRKPLFGPCMRDVTSLFCSQQLTLLLGDTKYGLQGA